MFSRKSAVSDWARTAESDFDKVVVQSTIDAAQVSPRLRAHASLPCGEPGWHRTLIAMTQDSYVPPHLHPVTDSANSERLVCVRGRCAVLLFSDTVSSTDARSNVAIVYLAPEQSDQCIIRGALRVRDGDQPIPALSARAVAIGPGLAHSVVALSELAILCESKTAADFAANRKVVLASFPTESDPGARELLSRWRRELGQRVA